MLSTILSAVTNFIISVISTLGYPGVALLMAIQTVAIPMPSEVIIPFAGYLAFTGRFSVPGIALAGAIGSVMGGSVAYFIGLKGGRPLVQRYGRHILISEHDLDLADKFFAKYGAAASFAGQLLPVVRSFISFPAGIARLAYWKFALYTFLGSFIWCLVLGSVGKALGENWASLRDRFHRLHTAVIAIIVISAAFWINRQIKARGKNKSSK